MPMYNPPHPGESVRVLCLEPFELSVADAWMRVQAAHELVRERAVGQRPQIARIGRPA